MLPALARAACAYSDPAELVLDPMCGIGTTLVEAIHLNRDAIGVELEPRWTAIAAGNVVLAREQAPFGCRAGGRSSPTRGGNTGGIDRYLARWLPCARRELAAPAMTHDDEPRVRTVRVTASVVH
jgi:DNA methylase